MKKKLGLDDYREVTVGGTKFKLIKAQDSGLFDSIVHDPLLRPERAFYFYWRVRKLDLDEDGDVRTSYTDTIQDFQRIGAENNAYWLVPMI